VDFDEAAGLLVTSASDEAARLFRLVPALTNATASVPSGILSGVPLPKAQSLLLLSGARSALRGDLDSAGVHLRPIASWPAATVLTATDRAIPTAFLGDSNGLVLQLDLVSQTPPRPLLTVSPPIRLLGVSPDARYLAVAEPNRLHLIQLGAASATPLTNWALPDIRSLSFSPQGDRVTVGCFSGLVAVCDTATHCLLWTDTNHFGLVYGLVFSPDGRRLASASFDRFTRIWDVATGVEVLPPLDNHTEAHSAAFDLAANTLAIGCERSVSLWNARSGRPLARLEMPGQSDALYRHTYSVAFPPSGALLAASDRIGHLAVWDTSIPSLLRDWEMSTPSFRDASRTRCVWLSENRLVAWSEAGGVKLINFPPPPRPSLLVDLAEWVIGQSVNTDGAVIRLDEPARAARLARLQAAAAKGELSPALTRLLPARR
jgi:WD40 repeat protein